VGRKMSHWWCCCECLIYTTSFPASELDNWTVTGSAAVASSALELTSAGALAILDTVHPQYPYPPRTIVKVKGGSSAELRVLLSYTAAGTDGIVIELRPGSAGCGELDIYQLSSSSESLISGTHGIPGMVADEWHDVSACYDPRDDSITVRITTADGRYSTISATISNHTYGESTGLATGATHSGTAYFDSFSFWRLWYYGDKEQDDWDGVYYGTDVTECSSCTAPGCVSIDADFTDADNLCEWDTPGSDWEIDETNLVLRSLAAHTLLHNLAKPAADENVQELYMRFKVASAGDTVEGIVCASDTSNYLACQVQVGMGTAETIGIVKLVDGSGTALSDEHKVNKVEAGNWYNLYVIYDADGYLTGWLWGDGGTTPDQSYQAAWCVVESNSGQSCSGEYSGVSATASGTEIQTFKTYWCFQLPTPGCAQWRDSTPDQYGDNGSSLDDNWEKIDGNDPTIISRPASSDLTDAEWAAGTSGILLSKDPVQPSVEDDYFLQASFNDEAYEANGTFSAGAVVGLVFGSDETGDNYYLAELAIGGGDVWPGAGGAYYNQLSLYQVNSGSKTLLDRESKCPIYTLVDNSKSYHRLAVCWQGGQAIVTMIYSGRVQSDAVAWEGNLTAYGRWWGVSVEAHASYPASVNAPSFHLIDRENELCPGCFIDCDICDNDEMPTQIVATVSGMTTPCCIFATPPAPYNKLRNADWTGINRAWYLYPWYSPYTDTKQACRWLSGTFSGSHDYYSGGWYTENWCAYLEIWFEDTGGGSYQLYGKLVVKYLWSVAGGSFDHTCIETGGGTNSGNEVHDLVGPVLTGAGGIAPAYGTIDCFEDLDGMELTGTYARSDCECDSDPSSPVSGNDYDVPITVTIQVPG